MQVDQENIRLMDIVFLNEQQGIPTAPQTIQNKLTNLRNFFQQAIHRANLLNREVLASFTYSIPAYPSLHVYKTFVTLNVGEQLYWEQPTEQRAFVGAGVTKSLETSGPERFHEAAEAWQMLQAGAIVENTAPENSNNGLILLGGFAFDPQNTHTPLWQGFGDGLLLLPHLLYTLQHNRATLSLNLLIQPEDREEELFQQSVAQLLDVEQMLEQTPQVLEEQEPGTNGKYTMQNLISADTWKNLVARAVQRIRNHDYKKVVLARAVQITCDQDTQAQFQISESLQRLSNSYPGAYVFAFQRGNRTFIGATPERLLQAQHEQIQAMALAGSAPRGTNPAEDTRLGAELLRSAKNKEEHAIVVHMIQAALQQYCDDVWVADSPQLLRLKNIQHMETPIVGKLHKGDSMLEAIQDLHPTPAVGGFPRQAALATIREIEGLDRGWYAGPVGWIDAAGNGEFAVALRSALVEKERATLFAGCGIVAHSDPESEYAESCLKLKVMLRGLGIEE